MKKGIKHVPYCQVSLRLTHQSKPKACGSTAPLSLSLSGWLSSHQLGSREHVYSRWKTEDASWRPQLNQVYFMLVRILYRKSFHHTIYSTHSLYFTWSNTSGVGKFLCQRKPSYRRTCIYDYDCGYPIVEQACPLLSGSTIRPITCTGRGQTCSNPIGLCS